MLKELYLLWLRLAAPQDLHYINGADTLPPPLPPEQERAALDALTRGQPQARDLLITHNLRLVVYIAKKFETPTAGIEDMISIGTIGLIKAVNTFEPTKNIKLATYASRCIENEILMYLRKSSNRRQDASIDEPLNTDWDGNELLLSDVLGTEGDGLDPETIARCDCTVCIPMAHGVDSLNVAAASAVAFWQLRGKYIQYAIDTKQQEIYLTLIHHKDEIGAYTEISKKFRL